MKKNNGFTLVEILAVVVLISLILVLIVPQVRKTNAKAKTKLCLNKMNTIENSINLWAKNNKSCFWKNEDICGGVKFDKKYETTIKDLAQAGVIDYDKNNDVINPKDSSSINNYKVELIKNEDLSISAKILLQNGESFEEDNNYIKTCGKEALNLIADDKDANDSLQIKEKIKIVGYDDYSTTNNIIAIKYAKKDTNKTIDSYCEKLGIEASYIYKDGDINDEQISCNYLRKKYNLKVSGEHVTIYQPSEFEIIWGTKVEIEFSIDNEYKVTGIEYVLDNNQTITYRIDEEQNKIVIDSMPKSNLTITIITKENAKEYEFIYLKQKLDNAEEYDEDINKETKVISTEEISNACEKTTFTGYNYYNYLVDENIQTVKCFYNRNKWKIYIEKDDNVELESAYDDEYKYGEEIKIKYNFKEGYMLKDISCNPEESCTVKGNKETTIIMPNSDVNVDISSKEKSKIQYTIATYLENANDSNMMLKTKQIEDIYSTDTIEDVCSNIPEGFKFTKELSEKLSSYDTTKKTAQCYYQRQTYDLEYDFNTDQTDKNELSGNNIKTYMPSAYDKVDIIRTNSTNTYNNVVTKYKYGQKIYFKYSSVKFGYEVTEPPTCTPEASCSTYGNTTVITMPSEKLTLKPNIGRTEQSYSVYVYLENANDSNMTKSTTTYNKINITFDDGKSINNIRDYACTLNNYLPSGYNYSALSKELSFVDIPNLKIECYYQRNIYNLLFNYSTDQKDSAGTDGNNIKSYMPSAYDKIDFKTTTTANTYTNVTAKYKYGQNILFKYDSVKFGYKVGITECNDANACQNINNYTKITMPNKDLTLTPKTEELIEPYDIYMYLENPNDGNMIKSDIVYNGVEVSFSGKTTNEVVDKICSDRIPNANQYQYTDSISKNLSYADTTTHKIECYYQRQTYDLEYDFNTDQTDKNELSGNNIKTYMPSAYDKVDIIRTNSTNTYNNVVTKYKYGQKIYFKYSSVKFGYEVTEPPTCTPEASCSTYGNTTVITMPSSNLTITPKIGRTEEKYSVYVYLENANDGNMIKSTATYDNIDITFNDGKSINTVRDEVCKLNKYLPEGYDYNDTISKSLSNLDVTNLKIDCYYQRDIYDLTFDFSNQNILSKAYMPSYYNALDKYTQETFDNKTAKYKYGQTICLKSKSLASGHTLIGATCKDADFNQVENACNQMGDTTIITMPNKNMTVSFETS